MCVTCGVSRCLCLCMCLSLCLCATWVGARTHFRTRACGEGSWRTHEACVLDDITTKDFATVRHPTARGPCSVTKTLHVPTPEALAPLRNCYNGAVAAMHVTSCNRSVNRSVTGTRRHMCCSITKTSPVSPFNRCAAHGFYVLSWLSQKTGPLCSSCATACSCFVF